MDRFNYNYESKFQKGSHKNYSMNAVPPPSSLNSSRGSSGAKHGGNQSELSKHGYSTMDAISQFANSSHYAVGKKRAVTEDEYVGFFFFFLEIDLLIFL